MAKVTGPLHSLTASGSIGGTLTMLRQFSNNIAKKKSRPGGAASAAQLARRAFYRQAAADWMALTVPQKQAWKPAGDARQVTAFNAYMSSRLAEYSPATGTPWDAGAAVWDGGTAIWS